jgi:hypothetical protein
VFIVNVKEKEGGYEVSSHLQDLEVRVVADVCSLGDPKVGIGAGDVGSRAV